MPETVQMAPPPQTLQTDDQKTIYALGALQAKNLEPANLSPAELTILEAGLSDASAGKPLQVDMKVYGPKAQNIIMARRSAAQLAAAAAQKSKDAPFLAQAEKESGAVKLPSGLIFKTLTPGTGATPGVNDLARVRYEGHLTDGKPFEGSAAHAGPEMIALTDMIPCWNEALRRMKVGESAQLVCPPSLAFGDQGRTNQVPPGATLVFNVELLSVGPKPPPKPLAKGSAKR